MITLDLTKASKPLSDYAKELGEDIVVLTSDSEPVAAIISLRDVDWESISLSTNPEFMKIIESARREFKDGQKLSFEEMKKQFESDNSR